MLPNTTDNIAQIGRPRSNPGVVIDDFVRYLITRSPHTPCAAIANVYQGIVPTEKHFQIALDVLLPILSTGTEVRFTPHEDIQKLLYEATKSSSRIAAAYVLYSLYSAHSIDMNPFHSALLEAFNIEEQLQSNCGLGNQKAAFNPQLTWVLWKILNGFGQELARLQPQELASENPSTFNLAALEGSDSGISRDKDILGDSRSDRPESGILSKSINESTDEVGTELARAVRLMLNARTRVLTLSEQRAVRPHLTSMVLPVPLLDIVDLPGLIAHNPDVAYQFLVLIITHHVDKRSDHMAVLGTLPPILSAFDVMGRLLKEPNVITVGGLQMTIGEVVRGEALGFFIHSCIDWIEKRESKAREEGNEPMDDSLDKATENLCRFYKSLINTALIDASSDIETTEMAHFALQHSRLEEANAIYRILVLGRI